MMTRPAFRLDRRRALRRVAMVAMAPVWILHGVSAQPVNALLERRVKAAFLYNFVAYLGWPPRAFDGPAAPVVMAIMGDAELAAELSVIVAGRSFAGRSFVVRRVGETDDLRGVHVLFVSHSESTRIPALVRATGNLPMLIVTESEGALEQGSIINFVVKDGRVKFDVALDAADKRAIKLSSRLLSVAQYVRPGTEP